MTEKTNCKNYNYILLLNIRQALMCVTMIWLFSFKKKKKKKVLELELSNLFMRNLTNDSSHA